MLKKKCNILLKVCDESVTEAVALPEGIKVTLFRAQR